MVLKICFLILCSFLACGICLFEMCNHNVELKPGEKLYINSPYYPAKYPVGTSCRYVLQAPRDYKIKLKCDIKLSTPHPAIKCQNEVFYFNPEASEVLTESEYFCGTRKIERKSFLNQAVIAYVSTSYYKRTLTNFTDEPEATTQTNEIKKTEIKNRKQQQNTTTTTATTTGMPTTSKALKENQITMLIAAQPTENTTTTTAMIVANNSTLSTSLAQQPLSSTISLPTSSAFAEHVKVYNNDMVATKTVGGNSFGNLVQIVKEACVTSTSNTTKPTITTNTNASRPASVLNFEQHLALHTWHNGSNANYKISIKRVAKIIAGHDYRGSQPAAAASFRSTEMGGTFSCLVEVMQPKCECGWGATVKIAGATGVAGINEFPSMAGIKTIKKQKIFCGATIIHHRYLLSAAHCYATPETRTPEYLSAVVGENDLSTVLESVNTRHYDIIRIISHEHFQATSITVQHDIALLKTRISIEWNRSVGPACLPINDIRGFKPYTGQRVETAGWGTTTFGGQQSFLLLKTSLDVISLSTCRIFIEHLPWGVFCTYTAERDACQYDSGGALYAREDRLYAVGIVSYGFACATRQPSINTRISSYIKWIRNHTKDAKYCAK